MIKEIIQNINFKKINIFLLSFTLFAFGYYLYQTISISSGNVALVALKKKFLVRSNGETAEKKDLDAGFAKETLGMTEIEKFDYIMVGLDEFALTERVGQTKQ